MRILDHKFKLPMLQKVVHRTLRNDRIVAKTSKSHIAAMAEERSDYNAPFWRTLVMIVIYVQPFMLTARGTPADSTQTLLQCNHFIKICQRNSKFRTVTDVAALVLIFRGFLCFHSLPLSLLFPFLCLAALCLSTFEFIFVLGEVSLLLFFVFWLLLVEPGLCLYFWPSLLVSAVDPATRFRFFRYDASAGLLIGATHAIPVQSVVPRFAGMEINGLFGQATSRTALFTNEGKSFRVVGLQVFGAFLSLLSAALSTPASQSIEIGAINREMGNRIQGSAPSAGLLRNYWSLGECVAGGTLGISLLGAIFALKVISVWLRSVSVEFNNRLDDLARTTSLLGYTVFSQGVISYDKIASWSGPFGCFNTPAARFAL